MTVQVKNIGIIKQAKFSLGDLTIICGENNTGKTYIAYALYGFLSSWREFIPITISDVQIQHLFTEKTLKIDLSRTGDWILSDACENYTKQLDEIFAASKGTFQNSEFHFLSNEIDICSEEYNGSYGSFLLFSKREGSEELTLTLKMEKGKEREIDATIVRNAINVIIKNAPFFDSVPKPFIFSSERTGVSIFRKELDYARSRLLDDVAYADKNIDMRQLLSKAYQSYPSPIKENIDFSRRLDDFVKNKSFIAKEHPDVLEDFADIVGGEYAVTQQDQLYYIPRGTQTKLTMVESSSAVRSLLDIGFYLRHIAEKRDLIMIDEPELSLHPENQRRIARLFARLANIGVKVFITTHSDYIIKELNTLIMLNHDKPHLKTIAEENGYQESELIKADQVKVYVAETALMPLEEGQQKRRRGHTLVPAKIHPKFGIEVPSFDKTIDEMNRIQDEIVWGEE
ncbi:hypothetical protein C6501_14795 [Candidatus Poribacteria bacterium]|nr:MAG: hypothetical protein C6501_14795 [Candidatus Poribacteria bacterium]